VLLIIILNNIYTFIQKSIVKLIIDRYILEKNVLVWVLNRLLNYNRFSESYFSTLFQGILSNWTKRSTIGI